MNRLVIIGNGFDLAHGLPTGYCDFINDYWRNVIMSLGNGFTDMGYKNSLFENDHVFIEIKFWNLDFNSRKDLRRQFAEQVHDYKTLKTFISDYNKIEIHHDDGNGSIQFKNKLFETLNEVNSANNWVDVENEYYKLLKNCLKHSGNSQIKKLNSEFEQVKNILEKYLKEKVENGFEFSVNLKGQFVQILKNKNYYAGELETLQMELTKKTANEIEEIHQNYRDFSVDNYFLSFNYTSTMKKYMELLGIDTERLNEIHGNLDDDNNPINFGFGDEMDKHYSQIEEKSDNEYLRNIKSFQYLDTSNYKHLLDLIDSDIFQVYIMGHSCGLSDRTLLNTIFEHENCRSIKIYYHKKEDGTDNYTELTQNISRHFNRKKLMREKIVNKTRCQPMPQVQLLKK